MLKKVPVGRELEITQLLSSPGLRRESHNHCVPLLEVIELPNTPDQKLMVMPFGRNAPKLCPAEPVRFSVIVSSGKPS